MNRVAFIRIGAAVAGAAVCLSLTSQPATACNSTPGCAMEVLEQSHDMMMDGRMTEAMRTGQENIQAFKRQQEAERAAAARRSDPK